MQWQRIGSIAGKDGANGKDAPAVDVDAIIARLAPSVADLVAKAVAAIPAPKDGRDGRDAKDGAPGRDALEIEILPTIDPAKSYPRGTFAQWQGGIIRAARETDVLKDGDLMAAGWHVVTEGVSGIRVIEASDLRSFALAIGTTSGKSLDIPFSVPAMLYRGVWADGEYARGDCVTWDGSVWHCEKATETKPGNGSADWKLCVKRGNNGKDGKDGARGERGLEGKAGRDGQKY